MSLFNLGCFVFLSPSVTPARLGKVVVGPSVEQGRTVGFYIESRGRRIATVKFDPLRRIEAKKVERRGDSLRFSPLLCPNPTLGRGSLVEVKANPEEPDFPIVKFRLEIEKFDPATWEAEMGPLPFHFLSCSLSGAEIFLQRGWSIPTPVLDDYPLLKAGGPEGVWIASSWSRNWTYAPPIGAYPIPYVGLWKPSEGKMVAYDFLPTRVLDNSEKYIASAYCWRLKTEGEFFTLVFPHGAPKYTRLRYPKGGEVVQSWFTLVWSREMASDASPNMFIFSRAFRRFRNFLPQVPEVGDLSWLPKVARLKTFPKPTPPRLYTIAPERDLYVKPGSLLLGGEHWAWPQVDFLFISRNEEGIKELRRQVEFMMKKATRWLEGGEECVYWRNPIEGDWRDIYGPGVPSLHNCWGWKVAQAFLSLYKNTADKTLLPYIDGTLRWTKRILFTRNGFYDVPAGMFAWEGVPAVHFCLSYHYLFREAPEPERRALAEEALKLAHSMAYRYLSFLIFDNDRDDDLLSCFLNEPNSGLYWLGAACSNEMSWMPHALTEAYVATGDPFLKWLLLGMTDRWHFLAREDYFPTILEQGNSFAECYGYFNHTSIGGRGIRSHYGVLGWECAAPLVYPVGEANLRAVCGERGAVAFVKGRDLNIAEYRVRRGSGWGTQEGPDFSLKIVGTREGKFDIVLTFPFFDLRHKSVFLVRGEERRALKRGEEFLAFDERPDSLYVKGVRVGDTVAVGKFDPSVEPIDISVPGAYRPLEGKLVEMFGFTIVNLAPYANEKVSLDWTDSGSNAGLHGGLLFSFGVPIYILPPEGRVCVKEGTVPLRGLRAKWLFIFVERRNEGRVEVLYADGRKEEVDLDKGAPALSGWPPAYEWSIDIVPHKVSGELRQVSVKGEVRLYGITAAGTSEEKIRAILERIEKKRKEVLPQRMLMKRLEKEFGPLFERASGRIGVLYYPFVGVPAITMETLRPFNKMRLMMHVRALKSPEELDPGEFWVVLYLGGEAYYTTFKRSLIWFLKQGGILVALPAEPIPFYYDERMEIVGDAPELGLPVEYGWEKPPEGVRLTFHVNPGQKVITSLPSTFPWTEEIRDTRWRPIRPPEVEGAVYTPLITLRDELGNSYGEAAALIEYRKGPLAPGRTLYVWQGLLRLPEIGQKIVVDVLRHVFSRELPVKQAPIVRATGKIEVDGFLEEPDWSFAPPLELVRRDGKEATHKTVARMLWDNENLYIAFECQDPDIWAKYAEFDMPHWEADIVEVFVDPDGDGRNYKEFGVAPNGAADDLNIPSAEALRDWRENAKWNAKGWVYKVKVEGTLENRKDKDRGWTVEMAIPLLNFSDQANLPPRVGDTWRLNLYRIDHSGEREPELLCLSPTFDGFHIPERFGKTIFAASLAKEDFSLHPEGSEGWPTWMPLVGEWTVKGGIYIGKNCTTPASDAWTAVGAVGGMKQWRNYELSVKFRIVSCGSDWRDGAWLGFRYFDARNCYTLCIHKRGLFLHKVSEGVSTGDRNPLAHFPWEPDDKWHEVKIVVKGAHIVVLLDGKKVISVVDENWNDVPPVLHGGVCLCARRFSGGEGDTVVEFDDVKLRILE